MVHDPLFQSGTPGTGPVDFEAVICKNSALAHLLAGAVAE
jgi:hypothetical protein